MAEHEVMTTDLEIEAALRRARPLTDEPRAQSVEYVASLRLLLVTLTNQRRLALPLEDLQDLDQATEAQLKDYELIGHGTGISFPALDVDLYVRALLEGVYGNRRWMAHLGRKGGSVKSEAKRRASQANGAKGGRPPRIAAVIV